MATKKELERALELACKYIDSRVLSLCDECPADAGFMVRGCHQRYDKRACKTVIKHHFIRKAQQATKGGL